MDAAAVAIKKESGEVDSTTVVPLADAMTPSDPPSEQLINEIRALAQDCNTRYNFNNRWDIVLSVLGILLSIAVVAAGFLKMPEISAVLGAIVGAVITAQKAFPFGQRATFYRLLIGQTNNLVTRAGQGLLTKKQTVDNLSTLRMDFAQQLPRGSNAEAKDSTANPVPAESPDPAANAK